DNAEQRIWGRLSEMRRMRKQKPSLIVGIIGCMAERLKEELTKGGTGVDIVAGPDAYRDLPRLVREVDNGSTGVNVELSKEETYAEIAPVRLDKNGVSAFIAIMRGCNNYCSYCVVPYTRGIERSRDAQTIVSEARTLFENGYREVTLLGQNVNSYRTGDVDFPELLRLVAEISPLLRVRFATSHPKDISDKLLETMASMPNICKAIHLPAQSGSTEMLKRMNRKYTREWYLERVAAIRRYMPDCAITTDLIAGFAHETEEEHRETLSLMREVGYDFAYMFKYSERPGTFAQRNLGDDIPEDVKTRRLTEIIDLQNTLSEESNKRDVGKEFEILVECTSKRSDEQLSGRTSQNKMVVFDRGDHKVGDYVRVRITGCSSATLFGEEIK
ncbi:MAG: tRNA (N6-isopentenyl adenosine(37)-C2)-methylthiotransferase MiaB, partial [Alistipes sp.]|nr:tRNA (N6-isopentenyl adenosine(37)-C2)-methylthiotransferase MiaB [Alistipes sp.]